MKEPCIPGAEDAPPFTDPSARAGRFPQGGLAPFLALSLVLHLALFAIVLLMVDRESTIAHTFVEERIEDAENETTRAAEQAERDWEDAVARMARDEVIRSLHEMVFPATEEPVRPELRQSLEEAFARFWDQEGAGALLADDLEQALGDLQEQWLQRLDGRLEELEQGYLDELLHRTLREDTVPELAYNVEKRLKAHLAGQLVSPAHRSFYDDEAFKTMPRPEKEALLDRLVEEQLDDLHAETRRLMDQELAGALSPAMEKAVNAGARDFAPYGRQQMIRDFLQEKLPTALREELARADIDVTPVSLQLRARHRLMDPEALLAAGEAIQQALPALRDWSPAGNGGGARGADELRVRELAGVSDAAMEALRKAAAVSRSATGDIERPLHVLRYRNPVPTANRALEAAERDKPDEYRRHMDETVRNVREAAQGMAQTVDALRREAVDARRARNERRAQPAQGDEAAMAAASAAMKNELNQVLAREMRGTMQSALGAAHVPGLLSVPGQVGPLDELLALRERLSGMSRSRAQARNTFPESLALASALRQESRFTGFDPEAGARLILAGHSERVQLNRGVYEEYVKTLQDRGRPEAEGPEARVPSGIDAVALPPGREVAAEIFAPGGRRPKETRGEAGAERTVTEPAFEYAAFGAAEMMSGPVLIDGDLSDWGPLRHPLRMGFRGQGTDRIQDGPEVYMRWSPRGLYFAARIKDDGGIQPCPDKVFVGDALEVWIDTLNSRRRLMREVPSSHQLFFTPFGFRGDPQATFAEWGRGARGLQLDRTYPDAARERGWSAARTEAGGYTIECFLKREALAEPRLLPGHYLAVNFSVNLGNWNQYQWSASKAVGTWDKPFTWGDVLLLGTDAEVAARPLVDAPSGRAAAALGEAIAVEVRDPDMNGHPGRTDRVMARAAVPGTGEQLVLILKETGLDSGVFTGSFNTAPVFEEVERHALRVRSGDLLMLTYVDAHRAFGERNQSLNTSYPIGWPVMRLATAEREP